MRFLTRTFRNVLYVRVGKLIVRLWRSFAALANGRLRRLAVRRKLEVGRRRLLPPLALAPRTRPAGTQTEPQLEPATSAGVILPETGQFLLSCSLQLWQQLRRCRRTGARTPLLLRHFTSVLRKQFAANDTFLREAYSYKRALVLRNSRLVCTGQ